MSEKTSLQILEKFICQAPSSPGVYRMLDEKKNVLYVGKAKNVHKRLTAYTHLEKLPKRLQQMVLLINHVTIVSTQTESEALLLESDLIKELKPKYNILLRDDKSYPYIQLSAEDFPRLMKYRGKLSKKEHFFGPFASAQAVNHTLQILQKAFLLRTCSNAIFNNRSRPCLLYQIKQCAAPCVEKISKKDYQNLVDQAVSFLSGKDKKNPSRSFFHNATGKHKSTL